MRLIDADELIKDDEVNLWLSNNAARTGKMLKMFSELFIKKINEQPTVEAIPKADMVDMLTELKTEIEEIVKEEEPNDKKWANGLHYSEKIIQQKIEKLKEEDHG